MGVPGKSLCPSFRSAGRLVEVPLPIDSLETFGRLLYSPYDFIFMFYSDILIIPNNGLIIPSICM